MEQQADKKVSRVLIGSPIHQKPAILLEFLDSLIQLRRDTIAIDFMFIDDNTVEESSRLLHSLQSGLGNVIIEPGSKQEAYHTDDQKHHWSGDLIDKVAGFKNRIILKAIELDYDYLFFVDSDLVLHPNTVEHLVSTGADIISEVFWTRWQPESIEMPQVWLFDEYNMARREPDEQLSSEDVVSRSVEFITQLRVPGVYEVGGLGACTLLSRNALLAGNNFSPLPNLSFIGEDRHFCVRAAALGFSMYADTHYPPLHIYRNSDLSRVSAYKRENQTREQENEKLLIKHALKQAMTGLGTFNYTYGYKNMWQHLFTDTLRESLMQQALADLEKHVEQGLITQAEVPVVEIVSFDDSSAVAQFMLVSSGVESGVNFQEKTTFEAVLLRNQSGQWQVDQFAPLAAQV